MKKLILLLMFIFISVNGKNLNVDNKFNLTYIQQPNINKNELLEQKLDTIITVISYVETNNDSTGFNPDENAAGLLQIRPIMVDEVNQILGFEKYKYVDRWSKQKSIEMFKIYQKFVNPNFDEELAARYWNGGRTGNIKSSTDRYVKLYYKHKEIIYDNSCLLAEK
ncbi:MAG: hypothetical protein ACOC2W_04475 [bacterium]